MPLFVDLDGTLVHTDTSTESAFRLIRRNIGFALLLPLWLLRGKAYLKDQVARRIPLDVEHLPYRTDVVEFLKQERAAGRRLILATAANQRYAQQVADHLGIFDGVTASGVTLNLEGRHKLARMKGLAEGGAFDYAADDLADMVIFPHARRCIVVAPPAPLRNALKRMTNIERVFEPQERRITGALASLRATRWPMNLIVLLPLVWPLEADGNAWFQGCLGAAAFCLAASGIYLFDDLLHLAERRRLPPDQRGAIAAGGIALQRAGVAIAVLWLLAFAIALALPGLFSLVLAGHIILAVLAVQDWFKAPRPLTAAVLAGNRIATGASLVAAPVPGLLWLIALAAGVGAELLRHRKIGFI